MHQPSAASLIQCELQGEPGREALRQVVANGEFFLLLLPDGGRLVHPIAMGERFPLNFGREVSLLKSPACRSSRMTPSQDNRMLPLSTSFL